MVRNEPKWNGTSRWRRSCREEAEKKIREEPKTGSWNSGV
jgi:hypothetical protein